MKLVWVNGTKFAQEIYDVTALGAKQVYFHSGAINAEVEGVEVSRKTIIDFFEGEINATILKECAKHIDRKYIEMGSTGQSLILRLSPTNETELNTSVLRDDNYTLWDQNIEFHKCPENIIDGITYIWNSPSGLFNYYEDEIHNAANIVRDYVFKGNDMSASRFRLSFPVPFDMVLLPSGLMKIKSRLKKKKLIRVAKHEIPGMGKGILFDFGNMRVWNQEIERKIYDHADLGLSSEIKRALLSVRDQPIPDVTQHKLNSWVEKIFDIGIDRLIKLPERTVQTLKLAVKTDDDGQILVEIGKKKIVFSWKTKDGLVKSIRSIKQIWPPRYGVISHCYFHSSKTRERGFLHWILHVQ